MIYEWDPEKRRENLEKHGVDFSVAEDLELENADIFIDTRRDYREQRHVAYAMIGERLYCLVFTLRGDRIRIISLRKANGREVKRHG
jgi:uncharacterized protein